MNKVKNYILMERGMLIPMLVASLFIGILIGCGIAVWTMMIRGLM